MTQPSEKPLTRKDACESYGKRWQTAHLTEDQWSEVLDRLYNGERATHIVRDMGLPERCRRSLSLHAKTHRGFIAFMQGVRMRDRRMQLGATMSDLWDQLMNRLGNIALSESTETKHTIKAAAIIQREIRELAQLADKVRREEGSLIEASDAKGAPPVDEELDAIFHRIYGVTVKPSKNT